MTPKTNRTSGRYLTENFTVTEIACPHCGICNPSKSSLFKLQLLRDMVGPLTINSACRCPVYNARIGGAPRSRHRCTDIIQSSAYDISLRGIEKERLYLSAIEVGFLGLGASYKTFLHVDDNRQRLTVW